MAQRIVPIADLANPGSFPEQWLNVSTNSPTNLFDVIDEDVDFQLANDDVRLRNNAAVGEHPFVVKLGSFEKPGTPNGWRIEWFQKFTDGLGGTTSDGTCKVECELRQGYVDESNKGLLIDTSDNFGAIGFPTYAIHKEVLNLSPTARESHAGAGPHCYGTAAITDFTDLSIRFIGERPPAQAIPDEIRITSVALFTAEPPLKKGTVKQFPFGEIVGHVEAVTSLANGSGVVQLTNPSGSPVLLIVRTIGIWGGGPDSVNAGGRQRLNAGRRTADPFAVGLGGSSHFGILRHADRTDTTTIYGYLRAFDFWNAEFHGPDAPNGNGWLEFEDGALIQCPYMLRPDKNFTSPKPDWVRPPGGYPLILSPGETWEMCWMDTGSGNNIRMIVGFDQLFLPLSS